MPAISDDDADKLAAKYGKRIAAQAQKAFDEFWAFLKANPDADPRSAIERVQAGWSGRYVQTLAAAFGELLKRSIGTAELRDMPIGGIALSTRLHKHNAQVIAEVLQIIRTHAAGVHDARELALRLYDGYNPKDGIKRPLEGVTRAELPKALRQLTADPEARRSLAKLVEDGQKQAARLKTQALRAAYTEAFDAWERGAGDAALKRALWVAQRERNRYAANRIAQTELARAHQAQVAQEVMADDRIEVVEWRLSPAHVVVDICDLHAKADLWGLGPGLYPKKEAPRPPAHPFCWCRARPRYTKTAQGARLVPGGEADFLRKHTLSHAGRIMGSKAKAQRVLGGERAEDIINAGKDPLYRLARVGDAVGHPLVRVAPKPAPAPPVPAPVATPVRVFEPQKTAKAAAEWAVRNGLADKADYTGIKPEVANAWNESLFNHVTEFPELRKNQRFTGTGQAQLALWYETALAKRVEMLRKLYPQLDDAALRSVAAKGVKRKTVSAKTYAHSWAQQDVAGVTINKTWGADVDKFKSSLARDVTAQWHPQACATIKSVVDHELGHQLDDLLGLAADPEVRRLFNEARAKGMKEQVSGYAATNIAEFIAECWAEAVNNPAPREYARAIARVVRGRYAGRFGTPAP